MNGTRVLEGYVPEVDAEIVRRLLAEGAHITGKTVCEAYCFSGGSHTAASGLVRNPHNPDHSAGGSSSGSAVVVATGEADMAIGCDQGGSIRMPASFSGIVGMKPTWSLVPYTGVLGMTAEIDHTGPMTRTIEDNALLLSVLAGADGEDSRQTNVRTEDYPGELSKGAGGLKVGIMKEGFELPFGDPAVNDRVREAAAGLEAAGVSVEDVSVPLHAAAGAITFASIQRIVTSMFDLDGCPLERPDLVPEGFVARQHTWREHTDTLPANVKVFLLAADLLKQQHGYRYVARGRYLLRELRAAYDQALQTYDALILPTTAMTAHRLPDADAPLAEHMQAASEPVSYTHLTLPTTSRV